MYVSTTQAPTPPELRAWVENPFESLPKDPSYLLCEIRSASAKEQIAEVVEVGSCNVFTVPLSKVHCVHNFLVRINKVTWIYGEPQS
jgi:hypothetical protein